MIASRTIRMEQIPRDGWAAYLDRLCDDTRDTPVSIRVEHQREQVLAAGLPLLAITVEADGPCSGAIRVLVQDPGGRVAHEIAAPRRIFVERASDPDGQRTCVDIEDQTGSMTTLSF